MKGFHLSKQHLMGILYATAGYRKVSALLFLLLLPVFAEAQSTPSQLFRQADSLRHLARLDTSTTLFQKAADLFDKKQDWPQKVNTLYKLSRNKTEQGQLDKADAYLENAFSLYQNKGLSADSLEIRYFYQKGLINEQRANYETALHNFRQGLTLAGDAKQPRLRVKLTVGIGDTYLSQGRYQDALQQFSRAQDLYFSSELRDKILLAQIYNSYGIAYQNSGDQKRALEFYQKSLDIKRRVLPPEHPSIARAHNNMAIVYYYQGDYQRTLEYFNNAVGVLIDFYGRNHSLVATAYNNLGIVNSEIGKLSEAAQNLEKAVHVREKVLGREHPDIAVGYQNLGAVYYDMKEYDKAIRYYKRSESIHLKNFPQGHPDLANVYANLGQAYAAKKQYEKALKYYQKDLGVNLRLLGPNHPFIGDTYTKIGQTYTKINNYRMALDYYQKALGVFLQDYSTEEAYQQLSFEEVAYPYLLLETLKLKGRALKTLAEEGEEGEKLKILDRSLQTHLQAATLIDQIQRSHSREGSKLVLRERTVGVYKTGFEVAYELYQQSDDEQYKKHAFFFAEKNRNQILLEQIRQMNARDIAQIPDSLINREQNLQSRLADLQSRISGVAANPQPSDSLQRATLQDSLFHARRMLDEHISMLENTYPRYHELKYQPVLTRASTVQEDILGPQQAMVSYFFGNESLFALVLTKNAFKIRKLPTDTLLTQEVKTYRHLIQDGTSLADFAQSSHHLYKMLIQPIDELIDGKDLLIIPEGILHYLPFESLVSSPVSNPESSRFHKLEYLVQNHTISYAPSAGYVQLSHRQEKSNPGKQFLGIAPGFSDVSASTKRNLYPDYERSLSSLPLSKKEVKEVSRLFDDNGIWSFLTSSREKSDIYIGNSASEQQFKRLPLEKYRYIHLATHAFVSEANPEKSGILFSPAQDSAEDGTLHANEIYNLKLNADLVTLSACETGIGTIVEGEGMMSLSRAFQYAGANNLLVSLWNVSDRSTARLMIDFYKQKKKGQAMPTALRKAKLAMIENGQYAHPKHWAPFIFIGQ